MEIVNKNIVNKSRARANTEKFQIMLEKIKPRTTFLLTISLKINFLIMHVTVLFGNTLAGNI